MSLDNLWFLIWRSFLLGFAQFLDQSHWLALQATGETPAGTAVHKLNQLVAGHFQQLVQVYTTLGELFEGTVVLESIINLFCSHFE